MTNQQKKKNYQLSEEDKKSWENIIKDIKKISYPIKAEDNKVIIKEIKEREQYEFTNISTLLSELTENTYNGIDKQTIKKFKKEEIAIEATLDLHGYTEKEAYEQVKTFIQTSYQKNKRCILIITGKGRTNSDDNIYTSTKGILRNGLPQWLNNPEIRPLILAFRHPSEAKGGKGAVCLLLKRKRTNLTKEQKKF